MRDPLSGPAALFACPSLGAPHMDTPVGAEWKAAPREKPQGWSASLALPFARTLAPTPVFWRLRPRAGASQKLNSAHPIHAGRSTQPLRAVSESTCRSACATSGGKGAPADAYWR